MMKQKVQSSRQYHRENPDLPGAAFPEMTRRKGIFQAYFQAWKTFFDRITQGSSSGFYCFQMLFLGCKHIPPVEYIQQFA